MRGFGATKPGSIIKSHVPVRTWTPSDEQRIGFLEIDLVSHCAINNRGQYLFTLVATDVASGLPSAWASRASVRTTSSLH